MKAILKWLVIGLLWSPLLGLLIAPGSSLDSVVLSGRQWSLLGHTVLYTFAVALLGTGVALGAALGLWQAKPGAGRIMVWLIVALVAVPGTVTAAAWMAVLSRAGLPTQGWIPTSLVQVLVLLPIAIGIVFVSLRALDGDILDAARCARSPARAIRDVVLPVVWPGVGAAFCVLAVLTISDFTVPSLFSTNVYALDIFAQFSGGSNPSGSAWPLLVVSIPLALLIARWAHRTISATGRPAKPVALESGWQPFASFGLAVFAIQVAVVIGSLIWQVGSIGGFGVIASHAQREAVSSLSIALLAAVATVALALPFAGELSGGVWALLVVAAALPASLVGIGTSAILNRFGDLGTTMAAPVAGMVIRFLPISVIAIAAFASRVDRGPIEAAAVFMRPSRFFVKAWVPLLGPSLVAAGCVVAALSLTELGATLILIPPGGNTLAIRLYNMLHYGASDEVAGLSLLMVAATLALSATLLRRPRWQR